MQIADYLGQYANTLSNAAAGASTTAGTANTMAQNLVSTLSELQAGTVFEGSINSIDGAKVLLGLSNGQTIAARLEGSVNLLLGQSVFFQVKSNDGNTVAIKPYMNGRAFNPTIQKALDAAGIEMTKDTIGLVEHMMEEGMPIDKNTLTSMYHTLLKDPQINMQTAIAMSRLGIPVNEQMAAQFENYQNDRHQMLGQMEQVMDGLPSAYARAAKGQVDILQFNQQILTILEDGMPQGEALKGLFQAVQQGEQPQAGTAVPLPEGQLPVGQGAVQEGKETAVREQVAGQQQVQEAVPEGKAVQDLASRPILELLGRERTAELEAQLKEVFPGNKEMRLDTQLTAKEFLDAVAGQLDNAPFLGDKKEALARLFLGRGYQMLLKDVMEQQWTVKPEDLRSGHKVEELYQRLDRQMAQLGQLAEKTGMNTGQLSQAAAEVRSNIEFMNQVNQMYTYVQIPLKMAGQNAHSDLYVYTNKRNLQKKEGELSAFLHLDLEHLGSTDVSIKMLDRNVSTKFYLADDAAYDLLEEHLPQLQERLEKLGYNCTVTIENNEKKVDFVEDFLQQGQAAAKAASRGMVHRYSFDVRA